MTLLEVDSGQWGWGWWSSRHVSGIASSSQRWLAFPATLSKRKGCENELWRAAFLCLLLILCTYTFTQCAFSMCDTLSVIVYMLVCNSSYICHYYFPLHVRVCHVWLKLTPWSCWCTPFPLPISTIQSLHPCSLLPPGTLTAWKNMLPQGPTRLFWLPRVAFPWKQCQSWLGECR